MLTSTVERIGRILLLCTPTLLALVFYPDLEAPFTDAKSALFYVLAALILASWLLVARRTKAGGSLPSMVHLAALALVGVTVLSYAISPWRYFGATAVLWSMTGVMLFWAMRQLLWQRSQSILYSIAIAGASSALIGAVQWIWSLDLFRLFGTTSVAPGRMAVYATLGNPDWLAAFLALTLPAIVHLALSTTQIVVRIVCIAFSTLSLLMIIATGSRAGMLASSMSLAVLLWLRGNRLLRRVAGLLAIGIVALAIFAPSALNRRSVGTAFHGRVVIWKTALSSPAPLWSIGSGPNTFAYLYPLRMGEYFSKHPEDVRFASYERHAQNDFVEAYAETGLAGLATVVMLGVIWTIVAWRVRKLAPEQAGYAAAGLAALAAVASLACFDFPLHRAETWVVSWMWLVLPVLILDHRREPTQRAGWMTALPAAAVLAAFIYFGTVPLLASHRVAIAQKREALGDLAGSEHSLRLSIDVWPSATAEFDLVRILGKQERYPEALEQSHRAEPWMSEPELFLLRSRILRAMGREDEANRTIYDSAARFPYSKLLAEEKAANPQPASGSVAPR